MKRSDLVTIALLDDFDKPRQALIVQSDQPHDTIIISSLLIAGNLVDAPLVRIDVVPNDENSLRKQSQSHDRKTGEAWGPYPASTEGS